MALVACDLAQIEHVERIHDRVAGPAHGGLGPQVQGRRLLPITLVVGEPAEHVQYSRRSGEIAELLEEGQRTLQVVRAIEGPEIHGRPVHHPERVGEHRLVPDRLGPLDGQGAPPDGPAMVTLLLAEPPVPRHQLRPLPIRRPAPVDRSSTRSPRLIQRSALP